MEFDQAKLEAAITSAISKGFENLKNSGDSPGPQQPLESGKPPPQEPLPAPAPNLIPPKQLEAQEQQQKDVLAGAKKVTNSMSALAGGLMTMIGQGTKDLMDNIADFNSELDDPENGALALLRSVQESMGGVTTASYAAGEAVQGIAGQAMKTYQHL